MLLLYFDPALHTALDVQTDLHDLGLTYFVDCGVGTVRVTSGWDVAYGSIIFDSDILSCLPPSEGASDDDMDLLFGDDWHSTHERD